MEILEKFWDLESGFFFLLREGVLNYEEGKELLRVLKNISFDDDEYIPRDAVKFLWYIPTFLDFNKENVEDHNQYEDFLLLKASIEEEVVRILELP